MLVTSLRWQRQHYSQTLTSSLPWEKKVVHVANPVHCVSTNFVFSSFLLEELWFGFVFPGIEKVSEKFLPHPTLRDGPQLLRWSSSSSFFVRDKPKEGKQLRHLAEATEYYVLTDEKGTCREMEVVHCPSPFSTQKMVLGSKQRSQNWGVNLVTLRKRQRHSRRCEPHSPDISKALDQRLETHTGRILEHK